MRCDKALRGNGVQGRRPHWPPLVQLVGEELAGAFMWMFEVALDDGTSAHAYKHIDTRGYLHLTDDGRAYTFRAPDHYDPTLPAVVLRDVLTPWWTQLGADRRDEALARAAIARAESADSVATGEQQ